jgi:hypothetical protein
VIFQIVDLMLRQRLNARWPAFDPDKQPTA